MKVSSSHSFALASSGLLFVLLLWSLLSYTGLVQSFFLPTPTRVLSAMGALLLTGSLIQDALASTLRIAVSFALSIAIAVPVGIALGASAKFKAVADPVIGFVRYIPPSAFIPLAILWFGVGELEKIFILFMAVAPYCALLIADVALNTRRELIDAALTLGATNNDVITRIVFPNALPGIWDSFRIMFGIAWTFVVIAEIVGASSGLGHLMVVSQRFLRTDNIFAAILVIGLLGLATDYFFTITYRIFFPWTEKSHA